MKRRLTVCVLCIFVIVSFLAHSGCSQFQPHNVQPFLSSQPLQVENPSIETQSGTVFKEQLPRRREVVKPFKKGYLFGLEDLLEIKSPLSPEFNRIIRIDLDGCISYPLIGRIFASSLAYESVRRGGN